MKRIQLITALLGALMIFTQGLNAQCSSQRATASLAAYHGPDKDIVEIAAGSADFSTLVAAVKAAGLVETLKGEGPFTVFAPTNDAFAGLPAGTLEHLLKPQNKKTLTGILTYHVVAGELDAEAVVKAIKTGKGKAEVKTVNGETLTATLRDGQVYLIDAQRNLAKVTQVDLRGENGVIHVIDRVIMPE